MKNRILGVLALLVMLGALVFVAANILKHPQNLSVLTGVIIVVLVGIIAAQFWNIYKNKNNWAIKTGYVIMALAVIVPAIGLPVAESLPGPATSGAGQFGPGLAVGVYSLFISVGLFTLSCFFFVIGAFLKNKTEVTLRS